MPIQPQFRDHTSPSFEVFVAACTVLPPLFLIYVYPMLPDQVPEYLNLHGDVEEWGFKGFASVFRLPLMAIDLQILCLLTKYGTWQASVIHLANGSHALTIHQRESLKVTNSLFDWFRAFIAIKLGASSLEVIFFSIERFNFLTTVTRVSSWVASILGVGGAIVYSYRLLVLSRKLKQVSGESKVKRQLDPSHWRGAIFYYNSADPRWLTEKYLPNFGNKWTYVFLGCLLCLPFLMFWPTLNS